MVRHLINVAICAGVILSSPFSSLMAKARNPEPSQRAVQTTLPAGEPVPLSATHTKLPLFVYGDETGRGDGFSPSGYMGDFDSLKAVASKYDASAPASTGRTSKTSLKITYLPKGREGWAGIYWLKPANNWGRIKGAGYDLRKSDRLTFWIRGDNGGEKVSEIKVGGINGPYPDSDVASLGTIKLSKYWEQYTIPLKGKDLSHIIGGFAIIFTRSDNPKGATIHLDAIVFEEKDVFLSSHFKTLNPSTASFGVPADVVQKSSETILLEPVRRVVLFSNTSQGFDEEGKKVLKEIYGLAQKHQNTSLLFIGHTDNIGPAEVNLKLSKERAKAVADYFKESGLDEKRMIVTGEGEEKPVASNDDKAGRQQNRRVEIVLQPS